MSTIILRTKSQPSAVGQLEVTILPNSVLAFDKQGQPICVTSGQVYQGRYPAVPDNQDAPALSFPNGGGTMYQWDCITKAWF